MVFFFTDFYRKTHGTNPFLKLHNLFFFDREQVVDHFYISVRQFLDFILPFFQIILGDFF